MAKIEILAGDFDETQKGEYSFGEFRVPLKKAECGFFKKARKFRDDEVEFIKELSEDDFRSVEATLGWGVAGVLIAGPLAGLAGGVLGGA